jgi:hypothetical protein
MFFTAKPFTFSRPKIVGDAGFVPSIHHLKTDSEPKKTGPLNDGPVFQNM